MYFQKMRLVLAAVDATDAEPDEQVPGTEEGDDTV